jgi:E3 ubiquitin-protein ligase HERC1
MCLEVMHPSTGLFVATPNKRAAQGPNQELLIPNPHATLPHHRQMFVYTGLLMTMAFISRLPQPFKFAEFVWSSLTGASMTIDDIFSIDAQFEAFMRQIDSGEIDDAEIDSHGLTFSVTGSVGDNLELFPGGSGVRVTKQRLPEYSQLCKKVRLREMKAQLDCLKEGISYFFPPDALFLLSPWELELLVCGDNNVSVTELKKHCRYDAKDKSSIMLWRVLESFSPEERMLFVKFATGRMGLPPPGSRWHSDLTVHWIQPGIKDDAAMPLPTAATCSSTIRIPRYSTEEWMAKKIRAAIVFGADIDADRQVNFADIVPLT